MDYVFGDTSNLTRARPDQLATTNIDGPPGILGIREAYLASNAAHQYAYEIRVGDELAANDAKLRAAGYNPPSLADTAYHVPIIGSWISDYTAATAFQTVMANGAEIAGPDERYQAATDRTNKERMAIQQSTQMIDEARTKHPELGIKTLDEIHNGVLEELKRAQTSDPAASGFAHNVIGGFIGAAADVFSPADPWSPLKFATLIPAVLGAGIGPNAIIRALSMGAVGAGMTALELGTDPGRTRKLLGMPEITSGDIVSSAVSAFALNTLFGGIGEFAAGPHGRAAMDDKFSWLSPAKRQAKDTALGLPTGTQRLDAQAAVPPLPATPAAAAPLPPDIARLAARPAGPTAFERMGAGATPEVTPLTSEGAPALPGLPPPARAPVPAQAVPAVTREALTRPPTEVAPPTPTEQMQTSPLAFVPNDQRVALRILDKFETKASKIRQAKAADHAGGQLQADGVAPQDLIAPSRPLSETATIMPDIREWQGTGAGQASDLRLPTEFKQRIASHVDRMIADDHSPTVEDVIARQFDPETWKRSDAILVELNKAREALGRVIRLHEKTAAGDTKALDEMVMTHERDRMAARSAGGRAAHTQALDQTIRYYNDLKKVRPGGTRPEAPAHLDQVRLAQRVADYEAKRDAIFPDLEQSKANSQGEFGLRAQEAQAFEERMRGDAPNWINSPWRYPKGYKRPRDAPKNPYEVTLLKGPTKQELFAERELDLPQLKTEEAATNAKPGEQPVDVATRVNEAQQKTAIETSVEDTYKQIGDFVKSLDETGGVKMAIGERSPVEKPHLAGVVKPGLIMTDKYGIQSIAGLRTAVGTQVRLLDGKVINITKFGEDMFHGKDIIDPSAVAAFKQPGETTWTNVFKPPSLPSGMTLPALAKMDHAFVLDGGKTGNLASAWKEIQADLDAFEAFSTCAKVP